MLTTLCWHPWRQDDRIRLMLDVLDLSAPAAPLESGKARDVARALKFLLSEDAANYR
jgi:hypothetical protein